MGMGTPPPPTRRGAGLWLAPAGVMIGLAGGLFATLFIEILGTAFGSSLSHPSPAVTLAADFGFDLAFVGAALYLTVVGGRMGRREFGYVPVGLLRGAQAFIAAGVVYYVVTWLYGLLLSLHGSDKLPSELGATRSTAALAVASVFVCVFAPMAEEFFFRGFLFGVLRRMRFRLAGRELGPWVAALIVGFLFGLAHTGSASSQYLIPLGFLGFVLCLVRWWTGSLLPCIALHSFNNALALGVNQLGWSWPEIAGLIVASWLIVAMAIRPLTVSTLRR
jgi:membrane protease YdiL (CAAX protease family)